MTGTVVEDGMTYCALHSAYDKPCNDRVVKILDVVVKREWVSLS